MNQNVLNNLVEFHQSGLTVSQMESGSVSALRWHKTMLRVIYLIKDESFVIHNSLNNSLGGLQITLNEMYSLEIYYIKSEKSVVVSIFDSQIDESVILCSTKFYYTFVFKQSNLFLNMLRTFVSSFT